MMKRTQVDGFVPRRAPGMIGNEMGSGRDINHKLPPVGLPPESNTGMQQRTASTGQFLTNEGGKGLVQTDHGLTRATNAGISRADIDESLRGIDSQLPEAPNGKPSKKPGGKSKRKKIIKTIIIVLILAVLAVVGWLGWKAISASNSVFKGDVFGLIQQKDLKQDERGRTNILVVGTSEDDPGHEGANLTDSIMVISLNQKKKNAYMISVPRDLYVKYGMACVSGYAGKVNAYFSCVDNGEDEAAEDKRQSASREFFGNIVGLDIQYSVHVNYSVMRDVVNAVGDITVNIEGSGGAPGVMDSNFDWKCKGGNENASLSTMRKNCPPNGHFIDYPNGPATLDAEHALYLAQARGDRAPTYGLGRSNFDRELNQQKIIVAIKDKATSTGTLTDLNKVTKLIDAIGDNLRTNFDTSEIRTLTSLGHDIQSSAIQSVSLIDAEPALFGSNGAGDVVPAAGTFNYSAIHAFIQKSINATALSKEKPHVVVLNASGVAGAAQREADRLTELGFEIDDIGNAPTTGVSGNAIYRLSTTKEQPLSLAKLQSIYGVTAKTTTSPPVTVAETTDFVVIVVTPTAPVDSAAPAN